MIIFLLYGYYNIAYTLLYVYKKGLVALDYGIGEKGDGSPGLINRNINKLNEIKIKSIGKSVVSDTVAGSLNTNLSSAINRENIKITDKKIVNNKPSQFGPILGVNFHNVKR